MCTTCPGHPHATTTAFQPPLSAERFAQVDRLKDRITDDAAANPALGITFLAFNALEGFVTVGMIRIDADACLAMHARYGGFIKLIQRHLLTQ